VIKTAELYCWYGNLRVVLKVET